MIARVWSARTTPDRTTPYFDYLREHVIPDLMGIDGFREVMLLSGETDGATESTVDVQVITMWDSLDAIRAFAGSDVEAAVVTPEAAALLTGHDRRTRHYEVVLREGR